MMSLHKLNFVLLGFIALTWSSFGNGAPSVSSRRSYKNIICGQYLCNRSVSKRSKSIARTKICDTVKDCPLGDDELDCPCKPLPAPDNGRVSYTGNHRYTLTALFTCDRQFELMGDSSRICQAPGIWLGNNPSCIVTECPPLPEDGHGRFIIDAPFQNRIGAQARLQCDPGYVTDAAVMTVCMSDGSWSTVGSLCQLRGCPPLPEDGHGRFIIDAPFQNRIGAQARLQCDAGYVIDAAVMTVCMSDGSWSPVGSSCQLRDCGQPVLVPNGGYTIIHGDGYDGSIAELTCGNGFEIASGLCIIVACRNGIWTPPIESCQAVCPLLPIVDHGTVQYSGLSPSSSLLSGAASASLVCDAGYEPPFSAILNAQCVGNVWSRSPLGPCVLQLPVCPIPWMQLGRSCYLLGTMPMNYAAARSFCGAQQAGADLVFLETAAENEFVKAKLIAAGGAFYWLGITDTAVPDTWTSSDLLQSVTLFDWAISQPDDGNGKRGCVMFWRGSVPLSYLWNDVRCVRADILPVCEFQL